MSPARRPLTMTAGRRRITGRGPMESDVRAAIFRQSALIVDDMAAPEPAEGQVLKTLACGICGSDLHFVHHADHVADVFERTGSPFPIDTSDIVMGHEFCGEVMERGWRGR
ncbi:alcohol dehydrogenase catalytic domain-containing protein [Sphingomonas sp. MMS24-JH45]